MKTAKNNKPELNIYIFLRIYFTMKTVSNYFLTILIIIFGICLIFFSSSNIAAVQSSIDLFLNAVFPSLFPFLIVSELLSYTTVVSFLSAKCEKIMKPLFNVPGVGAYPFIMGLLSGYPVGAKIVADLRAQNFISKSEGERLLIFTNNAGPLFVIGSIGFSMYLNSTIGFLFLGVNIVSSIFTGFIFGKFYSKNNRNYSNTKACELSFSSLADIISKSIRKAFFTLSNVCGFIILFSLIISMIKASGVLDLINNIWIQYFILGIIEITNGIKLISTISGQSLFFNLIFTSVLLGTGGICVLLQVWSCTSNTDLSIKPYILGKICCGLFAGGLMFIILNIFPILQFAI